ncbi:MAG: TMEM165/GDT1 family protein [Candidatus Omnitrophota bacterium]|nr:MAG: TMEM165/GDT1 family protein [Candidatus Omnitrophota bacterium]
MNFKVFLGTFATIMLAELFDKTELAIFSLGLKEHSKVSVFIGAMCAFFVATLLALFLGQFIARFIDAKTIRYVSAFVFFAAGTLILLGKL